MKIDEALAKVDYSTKKLQRLLNRLPDNEVFTTLEVSKRLRTSETTLRRHMRTLPKNQFFTGEHKNQGRLIGSEKAIIALIKEHNAQ